MTRFKDILYRLKIFQKKENLMSMSFGWYFTLKLSIVKFLEVKLILYDIDYYNKLGTSKPVCKKVGHHYGSKRYSSERI